ncbi:hypothetical protein SLEP1_g33404 [Rubroshorea leprosula]|uniref:TF-B3 domain-containing protein n=1 Tax=Rubroshorea leprosula TaxID=152421 RepID=A0AAV5KGP0_9ROSI|nr:hypothetical protein SLEP1_g33404 [Rubroshorea leprosula]
MAPIFEHRNIEQNDLERPLKFPCDAKLPNCWNLSCDGSSTTLDVIYDEKNTRKQLTVKKLPRGIYFTKGWNDFRIAKKIEKNDKISLHEDGNTYRIEVEKARKGR